jgi:hypothetical protein
MADPTTILGYATKLRDDAKAAITVAQQRLTEAQASITANREAAAQATTASADLEKQAADIRQKLSAIPTPADGETLLATLEQVTIRARTAQATILNAQTALLQAQADADRAQLDLANASAQATKAAADLNQAITAAKQRAAWVLALGTPPLSTLKTSATDAIDDTKVPEGVNFKDADARIKLDIPDKLLTRALDRRTNAVALVTQADSDTQAATDASLKERNDNGGLAGAAQKQWGLFQQAEAAVQDFVNTAEARFDRAQATLAQVANKANSPLTAEQRARINAADLKADREAAADVEKARDDKLTAVMLAQAALDDETLKAIAAGKEPDDVVAVQTARTNLGTAKNNFKLLDDPWRAEEKDRDEKLADVAVKQTELDQAIQKAIAAKKNPDTDVDVATAKVNLKTAQDDLADAETTYKESDHGILHAWEAAVPDTTWRLFADFEEAVRELNALKDADPVTLKSDWQTAETNYVKAQLLADASASVLAKLAVEQARLGARQENERQNGASRRFGALRGDN